MWDEAEAGYDFGPGHPMDPVRLLLTMRLVRALGLDRLPQVEVAAAPPATEEELRTVHLPEYLAAVRAAAADPAAADESRGLGTPDDPAFPAMHDASALIAGQSLAAADAVWRGPGHAVNVAGGLHHAKPGSAAGFCVYNDAALAVRRLLDLGAERVAYVDVDVHHGDGVQEVFWDDPRVLTISVHESPRTLFPGTGHATETGGPKAPGGAVNLPLPPGTGDTGWLRAISSTVPPLLAAFRPQALVSQHGADTHIEDPLAHLLVSLDAQRCAAALLHRLAHEHAGGRWLALGGGGYAIADVVPRSWTHLVAEAAGAAVDPATPTPEEWRAEVLRLTRQDAPRRMTDGFTPAWRPIDDGGYDPADRVDQAILATRRAVFPLHGLDAGAGW
ncbi:acetoin utilization protein AcuC [Allostreptomyces psammosilenae]|nr:acetoin utilization protein AcuC [Allostreptomyces psammosilenae]